MNILILFLVGLSFFATIVFLGEWTRARQDADYRAHVFVNDEALHKFQVENR